MRILETLDSGVKSSPVLSSLHIRVQANRGRFYFERVWHDDPTDVEVIGRVTPLADPKQKLLLEVDKGKGSWFEVVKGSAKKVLDAVANDTLGTFHGIGALDKSLREKGVSSRFETMMRDKFQFVYVKTGKKCTIQEALFHFFGVPIDVIAEPREWYRYHRKPLIREVSEDKTKILVNFTAMSISGEDFAGTCLYIKKDEKWHALRIKPNQSSNIATAIGWLKSRNWKDW